MGDILDRLQFHLRLFGLSGLITVLLSKFTHKQQLLCANEPSLSAPLYIRTRSTDIGVYKQIFRRQEYLFEINRAPQFIVDAGANIGLTSVYLANRFPEARILAIEPVESNFNLLVKNTAPYPNITPVMAALWGQAAEMDVLDPGLGANGFRVGPPDDQNGGATVTGQKIQAMTISSILSQYNLKTIDLLKIDIEGAELDVLRHAEAWIDQVDSMIVELHEPFAPGCSRTFYQATANFDLEWSQGELNYVTRRNGCLKSPTAVPIAHT